MKKIISLFGAAMILMTTLPGAVNVSAEDSGNLYTNGDFETGAVEPTKLNQYSIAELELTSEERHSGDYALKIKNRKDQSCGWGQEIAVEEGKTYIFSGYVKPAETAKATEYPYSVYFFNGGSFERLAGYDTLTIKKGSQWEWTRFVRVVKSKKDATTFPCLNLWASNSGEAADYYADDLYFGELDIGKIELDNSNKAEIPIIGENKLKLSAKAYNQLDGVEGMENVEINWSLPNDFNGVSLEENVLTIGDEASEGDIEIEARAVLGEKEKTESFTLHLEKEKEEVKTENLYTNGDFETGAVEPTKLNNYSIAELELTSEEKHSGDYALKIKNRKDESCGWGQSIAVEEGKTYIFSGYVKPAETAKATEYPYSVYFFNGGSFERLAGDDTLRIKKGNQWEWTRFVRVVKSKKDATTFPCLNLWKANGGEVADYYADDLYFGELKIAEFNADVPESIDIPKKGEKTIELTSEVKNQFGDELGLENAVIDWNLKNNTKGVKLDNNTLSVDYTAGEQTIKLLGTAKISNEDDSGMRKVYEIKLNPHDDSNVYIENAKLNGTVSAGEKLEVAYDYRQVNNEEDASEIKWFYSDSEQGEYKQIEGASGRTYTVEAAYGNSFIKAIIYPKTSTGRSAKEIETNVITVPKSPQAKNVKIDGDLFVGGTLKVSYDFYDANFDEENKSLTKIQWQRKTAADADFCNIENENAGEYILTDDDKDALIRAEVIPVSEKEPNDMESFYSNTLTGPTVPIAKNLKITKNGNTYYGKYEYFHEHNFAETETIMNWYEDDVFIGSGASVNVDHNNVVLKLEVIPMSEKAPYEGKAETATYNIPKKSGGGSSGSSGGGGIYIPPSINNAINEDKTDKPKDEEVKITDMEGHWAKEAAQKAVKSGIMTLDENQCFNPDEPVLRKQIVEYAAKTIGLEQTEYKNTFEDVSADDSYAMYLQTCVDAGIISEDIKFRPNDNMTRSEFAKVLVKLAEYKKLTNKAAYNEFSDEAEIRDWAKPYVKKSVELGLIKGNADGTFNPMGKVKRSELAAVLLRLNDTLE